MFFSVISICLWRFLTWLIQDPWKKDLWKISQLLFVIFCFLCLWPKTTATAKKRGLRRGTCRDSLRTWTSGWWMRWANLWSLVDQNVRLKATRNFKFFFWSLFSWFWFCFVFFSLWIALWLFDIGSPSPDVIFAFLFTLVQLSESPFFTFFFFFFFNHVLNTLLPTDIPIPFGSRPWSPRTAPRCLGTCGRNWSGSTDGSSVARKLSKLSPQFGETTSCSEKQCTSQS